LAQLSCKEIIPNHCCFWDLDALPLSVKCKLPVDTYNADFPVLCNLAGWNSCIDGSPSCGCCQSIKTLKTGEWVLPFLPCVLGSCKNCSIICSCYGACKEYCNQTKVAIVESNSDQQEQIQDQPLKAEVMARDAYDKTIEETVKLACSFGNSGRDQIGKTRMRDLNPCLGLCCCMSSCACKMPNYLGGFCEALVLFFNLSCSCCQPMVKVGDTFVLKFD
jgi:hypothetical protein